MLRTFLLVFLFAFGVQAQLPPVNGPIEGFVFDPPTRSIRPVIGTLGSALLGPALVEDLDFASVAPGRSYALVFKAERRTLFSSLGTLAPNATELPSQVAVPEGVAWAGDGSVAVLYSRTGNWIQVLKGLPDAPNAGPQLSLSALGPTLRAVTVDQNGDRIIFAIDGEASGVLRLSNEMSFTPIAPGARPVALTISADGSKLYFLDGETKQVSLVRLADLTAESWALDGLEEPFALRVLEDGAGGSTLLVAGRKDRLLRGYDVSTHESKFSLALDFEPALIEPLGLNSFWLTVRSKDGEIFWAYRPNRDPAVAFVPATPLIASEELR
jgi:hypothetical protein